MLDTLPSQIGFLLAALVAILAFAKGDEPERIGAGAFLLGAFATLLTHDRAALDGTRWSVFIIDLVFLAVCAGLAWKSRRAWPLWACGFQALVVMSHGLTLVDSRPPLVAFYLAINLAGYGVLLSIAAGAVLAWRDREAATRARLT